MLCFGQSSSNSGTPLAISVGRNTALGGGATMMSAGALFVLGILEGALLENVSSNCDSTGLVVEFRLCRLFRSVFPKTRKEETLDSLAIELE
jgi:hypothetical protein